LETIAKSFPFAKLQMAASAAWIKPTSFTCAESGNAALPKRG